MLTHLATDVLLRRGHRCAQLVDVGALGTCHTVSLCGCDQVVDVSGLAGVYSLDLSGQTTETRQTPSLQCMLQAAKMWRE